MVNPLSAIGQESLTWSCVVMRGLHSKQPPPENTPDMHVAPEPPHEVPYEHIEGWDAPDSDRDSAHTCSSGDSAFCGSSADDLSTCDDQLSVRSDDEPATGSDSDVEPTGSRTSTDLHLGCSAQCEGTAVGGAANSCVLAHGQVQRLLQVLGSTFLVHGLNGLPTLEIRPCALLADLKARLASQPELSLQGLRLNGSAASYVVACDHPTTTSHPCGWPSAVQYKDLDVLVLVDVQGPEAFDTIRDVVLACLRRWLPAGSGLAEASDSTLQAAYVAKLFRMPPAGHKGYRPGHGDSWSLVSLRNQHGRNIELKFVCRMRRQYEFSVDSFQVLLSDSILTAAALDAPSRGHLPHVEAESVFGPFGLARQHLNQRLIVTHQPEEMRGGGLLKYCSLLVRGYRLPPETSPRDRAQLQRCMCNRFLMDFGAAAQHVWSAVVNYINTHIGDPAMALLYLGHLHAVLATAAAPQRVDALACLVDLMLYCAQPLGMAQVAMVQQQYGLVRSWCVQIPLFGEKDSWGRHVPPGSPPSNGQACGSKNTHSQRKKNRNNHQSVRSPNPAKGEPVAAVGGGIVGSNTGWSCQQHSNWR